MNRQEESQIRRERKWRDYQSSLKKFNPLTISKIRSGNVACSRTFDMATIT
jgi:hypothetical protein